MEYHVSRDGQQFGPYTTEELQGYVSAGNVSLEDLAYDGQDWVPVAQVLGLPTPPPSTPASHPRMVQSPRARRTSMPANQPHAVRRPARQSTRAYAHTSPRTSGMAIASLILGILGLFLLGCLTSIPAIFCGHLANGEIRRSRGSVTGGGMATAGLVLGYIATSFLLIYAIGVVLFGIFTVPYQ